MAEFMRAQYQKSWSVARALLLTYRAKKAAQVDPFVGDETDLFIIGPGLGIQAELHDDVAKALHETHSVLVKEETNLRKAAYERIEEHVEKFISKRQETTVEQKGITVPASNETVIPEGFREGQPEDQAFST